MNKQDNIFAHKIIYYLESIIVQNINFDINNIIDFANILLFFKNQNSDHKFHEKFAIDNNMIVIKTQIHSFNHTATCFKYHQKNTEINTCKFTITSILKES